MPCKTEAMKRIAPLLFVILAATNICLAQTAQGGWGACEFATVTDMNNVDPSSSPYHCKKAYVQATNAHYKWDGSAWVLDVSDAENIYNTSDALTSERTVTLGNFGLHFDMTGSGDFRVEDNGNISFIVRDNGNVGIGLDNPARALHVADDVARFSRSANSAGFILDRYNTNLSNTMASVIFNLNSSSTGTGEFFFGNYNENVSGASYTRWLTFDIATDQLRLNPYGSNTYTGTLSRLLGVESDGDVIEVDPSSLGSDDQTLSWNSGTNEITIEDGNTIDISSVDTDTDDQTLSWNSTTNEITIVDGNTIDISSVIADNLYTADGTLQANRTVTMGSNSLTFDNGNDMIIQSDGDVGIGIADPTAEFEVAVDQSPASTVNAAFGVNDNLSSALITNLNASDWSRTITALTPNVSDGGISGLLTFGMDDSQGHAGHIFFVGDATSDDDAYIGYGIRSTNGDIMRMYGNGRLNFEQYGEGTLVDASPQYLLGVQADGDVVEVDPSSIGTDDQTASEVPITDAGGNFTSTNVEDALAELAGSSGTNFYSDDGSFDENRTVNFNGNQLDFDVDNNDFNVNLDGLGDFQIYDASTLTFSVNSDGEVGIGVANPARDFEVADGRQIRFSEYGAGDQTGGTATYILGVESSGDLIELDVSSVGTNTNIYNSDDSFTGNRTADLLNFSLDWDAGDGNVSWNLDGNGDFEITESSNSAFIVEDNGQVGIGLGSPDNKLHIRDTDGSRSALYISESVGQAHSANYGTITLNHEDSGGQSSIVFRSAANAGSDYGYINYSDDGSGNGSTSENSLLTIGIENDVTDQYQDDIAIMPSGALGIFTTSPGADVEIADDKTVRMAEYGDGNQINNSVTYVLGVDTDGDLVEVEASSLAGTTTNIYNSDGSLDGNRTMDLLNNSLDFDMGNADINFNVDGSGDLDIVLGSNGDFEVFDGSNIAFAINGAGDVGVGIQDANADFEVAEDWDIRFAEYGTGDNIDNSVTYVLGVDGDGDLVEVEASSLAGTTTNIYNSDGSLDGNRTMDLLNNSLDFDMGNADINFNVDGSGDLDIVLGSTGDFEVFDGSNIALAVNGDGDVGVGIQDANADFEVAEDWNIRFAEYGTGDNIDNSVTYVLGVDGDGDLVEVETSSLGGSSSVNIYNSDGTLDANRTVSQTSFDLTFDNDDDFIIQSDGDVGIGTTPSYQFHAVNNSNRDGFVFESNNSLTGEKDVFTIIDNDTGGGGQDESSVLKVEKAAQINNGDNGFSLVELAYTHANSGSITDNKYWISGRKVDEGAPEWGININDNQIWSNGGILLNATGADGGTYSGGDFIVETDGDVGIGTNAPNRRLEVSGGQVRFSNYGAGTYNDSSNDYLLSVDGSGDVVEVNTVKNSRIFYPPAIAIDASSTGNNIQVDLHDLYESLYSSPAISSTSAPSSIPTYAEGELYYYVTDYDNTVLNIDWINDSGVMRYDVLTVPSNDCTYINLVFVVR